MTGNSVSQSIIMHASNVADSLYYSRTKLTFVVSSKRDSYNSIVFVHNACKQYKVSEAARVLLALCFFMLKYHNLLNLVVLATAKN